MSQAQPSAKPAGGPSAAGTAPTIKPTETKPETTADAGAATDVDADEADEAKRRVPSKVYVVVGKVLVFDSVVKAEKYLNGPGAPSSYEVIRGRRVVPDNHVSLRG